MDDFSLNDLLRSVVITILLMLMVFAFIGTSEVVQRNKNWIECKDKLVTADCSRYLSK